ncbi:hypothetical protein E2562_014959 [Oryza meyeriana var. granulata]|uniref:Uncharacterized protein n=1 Tax=Oryza meyeriana var. granulata TaxID=110450 RepID=A0A6G1EII5_9ORYZ|nr:hypothetical protein E2562_014959 [Oryza meyeriana var. granulata]
MLDGKAHELGFAVTNAVDVWYVDGNLHLWLDPRSTATTANLVSYDAPRLAANTTSQFDGPNGQYHTTASRRISATGWVESPSHGRITTNATQTFTFENTQSFTSDGTAETENHTTVVHTGVSATDLAGAVLYSQQAHQNFPLYLDVEVVREYHETTVAAGRWWSEPPQRSLRNTQSGSVDVGKRDGKAVSATSRGRRTGAKPPTGATSGT